jgi:hypothetical protein
MFGPFLGDFLVRKYLAQNWALFSTEKSLAKLWASLSTGNVWPVVGIFSAQLRAIFDRKTFRSIFLATFWAKIIGPKFL